jgi:hypothetical protein
MWHETLPGYVMTLVEIVVACARVGLFAWALGGEDGLLAWLAPDTWSRLITHVTEDFSGVVVELIAFALLFLAVNVLVSAASKQTVLAMRFPVAASLDERRMLVDFALRNLIIIPLAVILLIAIPWGLACAGGRLLHAAPPPVAARRRRCRRADRHAPRECDLAGHVAPAVPD